MSAIVFLLFIALLIAAWAPARIRSLKNGAAEPFDSRSTGHPHSVGLRLH